MSGGASEYWSQLSQRGYAPNWFSLCGKEITRRVTGQTSMATTPYLVNKYSPARENLLEVGCLTGKKLGSLTAKHKYGLDIAADAIAQGKAIYPHLTLAVMDLNKPEPMPVKFDAVIANGVLHHIENLEACADWIVEHLTPQGVLVASEYLGPMRYRYAKAEIEAINAAVALLPVELQETFDVASLESKLRADPSESIRSRDIPDVLRAAGLDVRLFPYGGNTLQRTLGKHFFKHFDPGNPEHVAGLDRVIASDAEAMRRFPSHHAFIVATRRGNA